MLKQSVEHNSVSAVLMLYHSFVCRPLIATTTIIQRLHLLKGVITEWIHSIH